VPGGNGIGRGSPGDGAGSSLVVNPGVITSFFVATGLFGSVNSAMIATTWSTVGTGPVQGSCPGSPQSACAVAGAVMPASDTAINTAVTAVFMREY
jgi:hypothetical protein